MTHRLVTLALFACLAYGCGGGETLPAHVVVQETNGDYGPDGPPDCQAPNRVERTVERTCLEGVSAKVIVCSEEPVCEDEIDAIAEQVESCEDDAEEFDVEVAVCN